MLDPNTSLLATNAESPAAISSNNSTVMICVTDTTARVLLNMTVLKRRRRKLPLPEKQPALLLSR
jgi:hypothetical protein